MSDVELIPLNKHAEPILTDGMDEDARAAGVYELIPTGGEAMPDGALRVDLCPLPVAAFAMDQDVLCAGGSVSFTDQSQWPEEWAWDFGDESGSSDQNPTHQYPNAGSFTVSLTVRNKSGNTGTDTATDAVTVYAVPIAAFSFTVDGLTVNFTDESTGDVTQWTWDFGDESGSSDQSPSHTYAAPGNYTVTLTASNPACQDEASDTVSPELVNVVLVVDDLLSTATLDDDLEIVEHSITLGWRDITDNTIWEPHPDSSVTWNGADGQWEGWIWVSYSGSDSLKLRRIEPSDIEQWCVTKYRITYSCEITPVLNVNHTTGLADDYEDYESNTDVLTIYTDPDQQHPNALQLYEYRYLIPSYEKKQIIVTKIEMYVDSINSDPHI